MHRVSVAAFVIVAFIATSSTAYAGSITFSSAGPGAEGVELSASALFEVSGDTLKITLRNTGDSSGTSKDLSANTLTGVFFDVPTGLTLTPVSAAIAPGDLVQSNKCDVGPCTGSTTNVGGEFAYGTGAWAPQHAGSHAISSSGYLDPALGAGNFNGPNLDNPDAPNGINFGIIAPVTGTNPFKAETGNMKSNPLIEGEVVFTMLIAGGSLLESQISNVSFQYGTSFSEPKLPAGMSSPATIPEPATLLLLAPAIALAVRRRRSRTAR